jgi:hypothetical protein
MSREVLRLKSRIESRMRIIDTLLQRLTLWVLSSLNHSHFLSLWNPPFTSDYNKGHPVQNGEWTSSEPASSFLGNAPTGSDKFPPDKPCVSQWAPDLGLQRDSRRTSCKFSLPFVRTVQGFVIQARWESKWRRRLIFYPAAVHPRFVVHSIRRKLK